MSENQSAPRGVAKARPPALPATTSDLLGQRKFEMKRTLNDHVETIHLKLYENEDYQRLLDAVEGSLAADNLLAAKMIRDFAIADGFDPYVADKKLATIAKALGVVLRRYGVSRKERSRMIDGETVEPNGE